MSTFSEWLCERIMHRLMRRNLKGREHIAVYAWDYIGLQVMLYGTYEGEFLDQTLRFLREKGVNTEGNYVDVGANIGNHSVYFSRHARQVFAFEPNPKVYKLLQINAEGRAIDARNHGLSDRNAIVSFEVYPQNLGESRIVEASASGAQLQSIEVRKYDDIEDLRETKIDVLKIDVEFHEHEVLLGCQEMIARSRPAIIFEQMAEEIDNGTSETFELIARFGYSFYYYGNSIDLPRGIRSAGAALLSAVGDKKTFRPLNSLRKKSYNIVAIPN